MSSPSTLVGAAEPGGATRLLRLTIEYDGTEYSGWQTQAPTFGEKRGLLPRPRTIQGEIETALRRMLRDPDIDLVASGRTDAGVHAVAQVAHFRTGSGIRTRALIDGLNSMLERDLRIRDAREAEPDFHARHRATCREYRFQIWHGTPVPPFLRRFTYGVYSKLDVGAMRAAAALLHGTHDLSSFRAAGCSARTPMRTVTTSAVGEHGPLLVYAIRARGFLRHMVRNVVGALVYVGRGKLDVAGFRAVMAARDRRRAPPAAPPAGLFLYRVEYPGDAVASDVGEDPAPVLRFGTDLVSHGG